MTDPREGSRCLVGAGGSLVSRRVARRTLLLGGYVVAGWMGLCAFGGHHAEAAVVPPAAASHTAAHPQTTSAHAGLLDAVTASVTSGSQAAGAAPSNVAPALSHLADLAPVHTVLHGAASTPSGAPASHDADPKSSIVDQVGSVADLSDAVQIGKPVEDTLNAVTAPVHQIHRVVAPVTRTLPSGSGTIVDTVTDHVNDIVPGGDSASGSTPAPVNTPAPHSTAPVSADRPQATQPATGTAARHSQNSSSGRVSAAPVPALDPATHPAMNANRSGGHRVLPAAGAHPQDAAQTPRGSLRSGAGAPMAPPQNPQTPPNPGPIPVLPGNVAVAGASVTTSQLGSGFSGSALLADQMMTAARFRAVHTVQHDNARIARAEAAAPSCSPD
ncbi:MAG TPA: hypothetical protein VHC49_26245 [Mycobacteriales bacterium]|nr:hypothetical protein [Mycobacteriales bacterium]